MIELTDVDKLLFRELTDMEKVLIRALLKIGGLAELETSRIVGLIREATNEALDQATAMRESRVQ